MSSMRRLAPALLVFVAAAAVGGAVWWLLRQTPVVPVPAVIVVQASPVAPARPATQPVVVVDAAVPVVVDAPATPVTPDTDDGFRAAVRVFASRPGARRIVAAWGTLHLDGTAARQRFATLDVIIEKHDGIWHAVPGTAAHGVYVVEQAPGTYWLVGFQYDASSFHHEQRYDETDGSPFPGEPAWLELDVVGIAHGQNHNHGKNYATIALRDGRWVVLREDDDNVRRQPDEDVVHEFADDAGVCKSPCPLLAGHHFVGGDLLGLGPSAPSIAELPDGVVGDWTGL
jgi:hypothetical protein